MIELSLNVVYSVALGGLFVAAKLGSAWGNPSEAFSGLLVARDGLFLEIGDLEARPEWISAELRPRSATSCLSGVGFIYRHCSAFGKARH